MILRTARPSRVALALPMFAALLTLQYSGTECAPLRGNNETQPQGGDLPSDAARGGTSTFTEVRFHPAGLVLSSNPQSAAPSSPTSVNHSSPDDEMEHLKLSLPLISDSAHASNWILVEGGDMSGSSASRDKHAEDCGLPNCPRGAGFAARSIDASLLEGTSAESARDPGSLDARVTCAPSSVAHPTTESHADCADLIDSKFPVAGNPVRVVMPPDSPPSLPVAQAHGGADAGHDARPMSRSGKQRKAFALVCVRATFAVAFLSVALFMLAAPFPLGFRVGVPLLSAILFLLVIYTLMGGKKKFSCATKNETFRKAER